MGTLPGIESNWVVTVVRYIFFMNLGFSHYKQLFVFGPLMVIAVKWMIIEFTELWIMFCHGIKDTTWKGAGINFDPIQKKRRKKNTLGWICQSQWRGWDYYSSWGLAVSVCCRLMSPTLIICFFRGGLSLDCCHLERIYCKSCSAAAQTSPFKEITGKHSQLYCQHAICLLVRLRLSCFREFRSVFKSNGSDPSCPVARGAITGF